MPRSSGAQDAGGIATPAAATDVGQRYMHTCCKKGDGIVCASPTHAQGADAAGTHWWLDQRLDGAAAAA
jgi:hypothetical protein